MTAWFQSMLGRTRSDLLGLLRRSKRSVNDLAGELGISDNAVRMHLAAMSRDGMVEPAGVERSTGGKPAQLFQITPDAEELFPKAYAAVLAELIGVLEARLGREATAALMREIGSRVADAYGGATGDLSSRVQWAAAVLRSLGGDVEVESAGQDWLIRGYGCPLSAVVGSYPESCGLAETLVSEITGTDAIECCDRSERPRCAFRVPGGIPG